MLKCTTRDTIVSVEFMTVQQCSKGIFWIFRCSVVFFCKYQLECLQTVVSRNLLNEERCFEWKVFLLISASKTRQSNNLRRMFPSNLSWFLSPTFALTAGLFSAKSHTETSYIPRRQIGRDVVFTFSHQIYGFQNAPNFVEKIVQSVLPID